MTRINGAFKAFKPDLYSDPTAGQAPGGAPEAGLAELKARLEEAYAQLEAMEVEYLNDVQYRERERLMVTMKAEMAAIDAYGIGGGAPADAAGADEWIPSELSPGWNNVPAGYPSTEVFPGDGHYMNDDYGRYGEYAGSIEIPNSADYAHPHTIAFQLSEGEGVIGETHGRDLVLIVPAADGSRKYYVIKDYTVRPEPLVISAYGLTGGVTIDMRQVIRVNDGTHPPQAYATQKTYISGGNGDDIIYGSMSRDKIVAMGGSDKIDAGAGDDAVWGDSYYEVAGSTDPMDGGDDEIRGGAGTDTLYGGGRMDTGYVSDKGEHLYEFDRAPLNDVLAEPPAWDDFITSPDDVWEADEDAEEAGTIVLHNVSEGDDVQGGIINIDMEQLEEEGYNMAYAEEDANGNLVITFVGSDPGDGSPQTFKLVIEAFFSIFGGIENPNGVVRLNIQGGDGDGIYDFSRVTTAGQIINIAGGDGDDIILGAKSALLADGIDPGSALESQHNSPGVLNGMVNEGIYYVTEDTPYADPADKSKYNGFEASVEDGQIVIEDEDGDPTNNGETLSIVVPPGYEKAYLTQDAEGNFYLIAVKPGTGGAEAQTIVFKIDHNTGLGWDGITARYRIPGSNNDDDEDSYSYVTITAIADLLSDDPSGGEFDIGYNFTLDGGDGTDMVIGQKGSHNEDEPGEFTELGEQQAQEIPPAAIPGDTNGDGVVDDADGGGGGGGGGGGA